MPHPGTPPEALRVCAATARNPRSVSISTDQFRQVGEENSRQQASPATTCWRQGTMNLTAAQVMIKSLDGGEHHGVGAPMATCYPIVPLPDEVVDTV